MAKAEMGVNIVYIPGNHDDSFRKWANTTIKGISIQKDAVHTTADGRKLWILHGDEFDLFMRQSKLLCHLGHSSIQILMRLNRSVAWIRRKFRLKPWSLATSVRRTFQNSSKTFRRFSKTITEEANRRGYDGVVCGHIHKAEFKLLDGIEYWNDGDWVESCTAVTETMDGTMDILHYQPTDFTVNSLRLRAAQRFEEMNLSNQDPLDVQLIQEAFL